MSRDSVERVSELFADDEASGTRRSASHEFSDGTCVLAAPSCGGTRDSPPSSALQVKPRAVRLPHCRPLRSPGSAAVRPKASRPPSARDARTRSRSAALSVRIGRASSHAREHFQISLGQTPLRRPPALPPRVQAALEARSTLRYRSGGGGHRTRVPARASTCSQRLQSSQSAHPIPRSHSDLSTCCSGAGAGPVDRRRDASVFF